MTKHMSKSMERLSNVLSPPPSTGHSQWGPGDQNNLLSHIHEEASTVVGRELSHLSPHAVEEVQGPRSNCGDTRSVRWRGASRTLKLSARSYTQSHSPQFTRVPI